MMKLRLYALLLVCTSVLVGALPDGFIVETVTSKARGTTGLFAPHPAGGSNPPILLIVEKKGKVTVLENPDESPDTKTILDLDGKICTDGERGLQSITIHPNFEENRFVYLFYSEYVEGCPDSATEGTWNVVSRFVLNPYTFALDYEKRQEIWRTSRLRYNVHNGGAMAFGNDGKLYVTTGDSGRKTLSQPVDNTLGSIIRLNDDGSIPEDNPYTSSKGYEAYRCADTDGRVPATSKIGVCAEIFAHGFRNPFRMRMDPMETKKVRFSVGDVGGAYWEELSIGGTDYAGRNYGWPNWEGPCRESSFTNCSVPNDESIEEPYHYYEHRSMQEGGAVAGSVFVPPGLWPSKYKFLFIDFIYLQIYNLIEEPERECRSCIPPVSGYRNETFYNSIQQDDEHVNSARMVDMFFGPYKDTQALYVIRFGNHDTVLRIRYNDIVDNTPPIADFQVPDVKFVLGTSVSFDGSVSSDPEGDDLTFEWDFGDGNTSNETNPSYQFSDVGEYDVVLKVTDTYGQMQQKTETIVIGIPPAAKIVSPAEGDVFYVGEVLQLQGEAYDHMGMKLDDMKLSWEVRKHHADHFHPFMDMTLGNDITLYPAPEPEDFFAATSSYLRIILVATDKSGLTTQIDRIVNPSLVSVGIESKPQGLSVMVDTFPVTTSRTAASWKEHNLRLEAKDQAGYMFKAWSDGSTERERTMKLLDDYQTIQANFCKADKRSCSKWDECCSEFCNKKVCQPFVTESPTESFVTESPTTAPTIRPTFRPSTAEPTPRIVSIETSTHQNTGSEFTKTPMKEVPSFAPSFQEPSLTTTSDVKVPRKQSSFIASVLLSFFIAIFFLMILPFMVFKAKQIKRKEQRGEDHTAPKQLYHGKRFVDVEQEIDNITLNDCSF